MMPDPIWDEITETVGRWRAIALERMRPALESLGGETSPYVQAWLHWLGGECLTMQMSCLADPTLLALLQAELDDPEPGAPPIAPPYPGIDRPGARVAFRSVIARVEAFERAVEFDTILRDAPELLPRLEQNGA